jgi:hypothetical protein
MTTKITTDNIQPNTVVTYSEFTENLVPKIGNVSVANSSYTVLDDTAVNVGGGYIVVSGAGFQDGATVIISGTQATSVSYVNSSTLHAQVPAKSAATYNLYVVNPDGGTAIGPNKLTYSGSPTWVTEATLLQQSTDVPFDITFEATGATSYANTTELPAGTTLLSNGYFYGTITVETDTTYNFTIRASDDELQDSDKTFSLDVLVISYYVATGGTITTDGDYKIHTFTSSDSFDVTVVPLTSPENNIEYLIVAGGGGAINAPGTGSGAGGGGGFLTGNTTVSTGTYSVVIGAGGAAVTSPSAVTNNGGNSSALGFTAIGGGGSGRDGSKNGKSGGSGGGAYFYPGTGGAGTPGQGNNGGNAAFPGSGGGSGGGGGAGGAGGIVNAGAGRLSPLSGVATYYGGGGAGINVGTQAPSTTGSGRNTTGDGQPNSGQGATAGASGGSGIVILKYKYQ